MLGDRPRASRAARQPGVRAPGAALRCDARTTTTTCRDAAPTCSPKEKAARGASRCSPPARRWRSRCRHARRCRPRNSDGSGLDALLGAVRCAGRRLPPAVLQPGTVRVAVEAAVRFGWDRYLGERRRLRRHDRLRRVRPGRGALRALRHHAGGDRRRGEAVACTLVQLRSRLTMHKIVFLDRSTIAPQIRLRRPHFDHELIEHEQHRAPTRSSSDWPGATIAIINKVPLACRRSQRLPESCA